MEPLMNLINLKKDIPCKWRVQSFSKFKKSAICIPYVDARDVMDVLDEVVGPGLWQDDFKEVSGKMICGIGIYIGDQWVWKWDIGNKSNIEKDKGLMSDSFKRAAIKWGIGRFLYRTGEIRVPASEKKTKDNFPHVVDSSKKRVYDLTVYITKTLKNKPSSEDRKIAPFWIERADECETSADMFRWYNNNQGEIGKHLDEAEIGKLLKYLKSAKETFFAKEYVECPNLSEAEDTTVLRKECEKCDSKEGCPTFE